MLHDRLTDVGLVDQREMYETRRTRQPPTPPTVDRDETSAKSPKHHIRLQQTKKHHGPDKGQVSVVVGKEVDGDVLLLSDDPTDLLGPMK